MPDEYARISDLTRAIEVEPFSLVELATPNGGSETGFDSMAASLEVIARAMLGGIEFQTELNTDAKKIFDAINELESKLCYKAGDTLSFSSPYSAFYGFINVSKTSLFFNVPLSKPVLADEFTVTGELTVRGNRGVVNGGVAVPLDGDNVIVTKIDNGLSIRVNLTQEATGVDSNVPISGMPLGAPVTITFN